MAKLFKNPVISLEEVFLNQPQTISTEPEHPLIPANEQHMELARKEAYDQGYLCGITEEKTRQEEELKQLKQQLQNALANIPQAIAYNRLQLNNEIADIVLLITQQFFIENHTNPKTLALQINQILTQLNNKQTVELNLHPQEITVLQSGSMQLETSHLNGLKIKPDESLSLGGYIIKTNHGVFDASIEKQIDKLKEVLLQIKHKGQHASLD